MTNLRENASSETNIMTTIGESGFFPRTAEKISEFIALPAGWHYGDGVPAKRDVCALANQFLVLSYQLGFTKTDAFPGIDGGIALTIYKSEHYICLDFNGDTSIDFYYENGAQTIIEEERVSVIVARKYLNKISGEIWGTFDSSTQNIMITTEENSTTRPLRTVQQTAAFPSFAGDALVPRGPAFVIILRNTMTPVYRESRRYTGNSRSPSSLPATA